MNEEQYAQIKADLASNDTEHKSFKHRLDEHDEALKKQGEILLIMERQSNAIEKMSGAVGRVERRWTASTTAWLYSKRNPPTSGKRFPLRSSSTLS